MISRVADSSRNAGLLFPCAWKRGTRPGRFASVPVWPSVPPAHGVGMSPRVPALCLGHGWGCQSQFILTTRTSPSQSFSPTLHSPHLPRKREASFFFF